MADFALASPLLGFDSLAALISSKHITCFASNSIVML